MAHELEAWNLHAEQASSLELYALSLALNGSSTTGIGGTPFLAGDGNFRFKSLAEEVAARKKTKRPLILCAIV